MHKKLKILEDKKPMKCFKPIQRLPKKVIVRKFNGKLNFITQLLCKNYELYYFSHFIIDIEGNIFEIIIERISEFFAERIEVLVIYNILANISDLKIMKKEKK